MGNPRLVAKPGIQTYFAYFTAAGNTLFFVSEGGSSGRELWKSDGTTAGTSLVKDIYPGISGSFRFGARLAAIGNTLFFFANDGSNGNELWKSDGTTAGTSLVKDIYPGIATNGSHGDSLTAAGNTLYFSTDDGSNGNELWKSDGTTAGTTLLKDILPGPWPSTPRYLTTAGNTLYFTADDINSWLYGYGGRDLWKSDGTSMGTSLALDILPTSSLSTISELTAAGNSLFFVLGDSLWPRELWKSDDTGTTRVANISPGSSSSYNSLLTAVGSTVFFAASEVFGEDRELWKSDGTTAGTVRVKDIRPGSASSYPDKLIAVGNTLFFTARDGSFGEELWKSDGTSAGTTIVKDIAYSADYPSIASSFARDLTAVGNTLYFTADNGISGRELWKSDGTSAGTTLVADLTPGSNSSDISNIKLVGNTLFFSLGADLWAMDVSEDILLPTVSFAAPPAAVTEDGPNSLAYTLSRTGSSSSPLTVSLSLGGSASASSGDYANPNGFTLSSGFATFAAGSSTATLTIDPSSDAEVEADETVIISLNPGLGYAIGAQATATGTILNDDSQIEAKGNAFLNRRSDGQAVVFKGTTSFNVSSPWGANTGDTNSDWLMLAAESIGGNNQILWRYKPTNQIHTWTLNPNWAWQSSSPLINRTSPETWAIESGFQIDLNGDSIIGTP
ncbi:MAG: ELWxxDGT repeat protein [Synechococcaceae cyanobacterium]